MKIRYCGILYSFLALMTKSLNKNNLIYNFDKICDTCANFSINITLLLFNDNSKKKARR